MNNTVTIYTDGSSRGNPGRGGYGAILIYKDIKKEISGGYRHTTNNRMELMAVIASLQSLKKTDLDIIIYSDSSYVVNTVEKKWIDSWIKNDFRGKKNKDLWLLYSEIAKNHNIHFRWVKGHASNEYNNRCDKLATEAADGSKLMVDKEYEFSQK